MGRTQYNMVFRETTDEELLLNIVRFRYLEPPYFLELKSLNTQFLFNPKAAASTDAETKAAVSKPSAARRSASVSLASPRRNTLLSSTP